MKTMLFTSYIITDTPIESKKRTLSIEFLSFFDSNRLYSLGAHNYLIISKNIQSYGIIKAFDWILKAFYRINKAFHGMIKGSYRINKVSTGCLKRFTGRLKNHWIDKASRWIIKANLFHGMIKAFGLASRTKKVRRTVKANLRDN